MWIPYAVATLVVSAVAVAGALATDIGPWYRALRKPSWQPPDWVFAPAWTTIFVLLVIAVGQAWNRGAANERVVLLWLLGSNLSLNVLWSVLFFTLKRPRWALVEVVLLWLSIAALMVHALPYSPLSSALMVPYILWTSFAFALNLTIVRINPQMSVSARAEKADRSSAR